MLNQIVRGTSPNEDKEIAIYEVRNKDFVDCYSIKDEYFTLTTAEKAIMRKNPRSSKYMFIKKNDKDPLLKHMNLKEQCEEINKEAIKLKALTDGKLNLFRTGSVAKTSLQLWYTLSKPPIADNIEDYEVDILEYGSGALIWGNPHSGRCYKYDITSEYPFLMSSAQHKYPIGKGELKTYTTEEFDKLDFYSFGMYHCKVHNIDRRTFKENPKKWYTHSELNFAKTKLKLKIEIIMNDEPNCLYYDSTKLISGNKLFGDFVTYLFKLKKDHKEVKKYLNCLWGAIVQTNTMTICDTKIFEGREILTITPTDNGALLFETFIKEKYYDLPYARIKPFLMAYGRIKIAAIVLSNLDNVVRCHTDGIICTKPITNVTLGNELGMLKYEAYSYCKILNNNNYVWLQEKIDEL